MRVALIGYGAVAAVHAEGLKDRCELEVVVGPEGGKAEHFAAAHGIRRIETDLESGLNGVHAAIICSPSPLHYQQAMTVLQSGVHALVELPACASKIEANHLGELAVAADVQLQCAHTSRYLEPYLRIGNAIRDGELGEIEQIMYARSIAPRVRSWLDDALLHHAEHPLDLVLYWLGGITPLGCAAHPHVPGAQNLSLLGALPGGAPCTIVISYTSRLPETKMTIIGSRHTIVTDGFSYIDSDAAELKWRGSEQGVYKQAISYQDDAFLRACESGSGGIPWNETLRLAACVDEFGGLWKR
jgi:2-hydroxy-4-carboxymuconate semialdehyde hemiacetal dehydrogenase